LRQAIPPHFRRLENAAMVVTRAQSITLRPLICAILILLFPATTVRAQSKCTETIVSESATATSRETAERNAQARLLQKLRKLRGGIRQPEAAPQIDCKHPLMWHCTATVKTCL